MKKTNKILNTYWTTKPHKDTSKAIFIKAAT